MRTALAVLAGYALFAFSAAALYVVTGLEATPAASTGFVVGRVAFGIVVAALAGVIAGRIARERHRLAALSLALVIAAGAVVTLMERPDVTTLWIQIAAVLLMAPAAVAGDWLLGPERGE
ncbi:MAG TPA: hypothetical protein VKB18_02185 [Gemmatimonadota bacterium]|nr:hypothetical protein [Gemmatimonadota bacterium]